MKFDWWTGVSLCVYINYEIVCVFCEKHLKFVWLFIWKSFKFRTVGKQDYILFYRQLSVTFCKCIEYIDTRNITKNGNIGYSLGKLGLVLIYA